MIETGTLLQNRYRVNRQVGQGGMGAVYVATDERFQSTVAIKRTFFDDPALKKAFEREAHLLNRLRHPALPKVSDHFEEGDSQFLVMEYIEGEDFAELLRRRNAAFPLADVLAWADELLDALGYLHAQEPAVVHRDIKPQNMKLTPEGRVVLLDFGLAKGHSTRTSASATASVFGYSPHYAPLEQMQGTGTDTRSDLYSLAATLYHLMTGATPADALTRAGATVKGQPDPLRPAHVAHAQVPEAVGKIIQRAMSQNAALRHGSAKEMRAALRQAAALSGARPPQRVSAGAATEPRPAGTPNFDATVLEHASPASAPDATSVRHRPRPESTPSFARVESPASDSTGQAPASVATHAARARHAPLPAHSGPAAQRLVRTALVVLLVGCAGAASYLLLARPAAPTSKPEARAETRETAPGGEATTSPDASQPSAAGDAPNASYPATQPDAAAQPSAPAQKSDGAPSADTWSAGAPSAGGAEAGGGGAGASPAGAPSASSGASSSDGLVIQNPAPASYPAAEEAARRAEEAKAAQQRPAAQPAPDARYGPPPGGFRPPPPDGRRPPPPPGFPPPRP